MKEFIAYEGEALTVEWFFDKKGKSEALDFFETLSDAQKRKILMLFKRIGSKKNGKLLLKGKKWRLL